MSKDYAQLAKKVTKLTKHAHLQIMAKTPAKFEKNRHKTVRGVAHTARYLIWKNGSTGSRVVPNTATFEQSYSVSHISTNTATGFE